MQTPTVFARIKIQLLTISFRILALNLSFIAEKIMHTMSAIKNIYPEKSTIRILKNLSNNGF